MTLRAAIYVRVSTTKQAESDLSIPDQINSCEAFAASKGWTVAKQFVDAGKSATTDNRPEFQAMLAEACSPSKPFDVVLVHSQSRFARNTLDLLTNEKRLNKAGVSLVSITQDFGNGNEAQMMRTMMGVFDEYNSKENAKHTSRSMIENAKEGFWNGSKPPLGYRTYVAEVRGKKEKKRVEIEPQGAELVHLIFKLYVNGDGKSGPMGIKKITSYLNVHGLRKPSGKDFAVSTVGMILRNAAYIGQHYFNKMDSRAKKEHPREEWVPVAMPPLIDENTFYAAQERLSQSNPRKTAPRITSSNVLLTGVATCSHCGGSMKIQTGKGGRYRYYKCRSCMDKGKAACKGVTIPEAKLDKMVLESLCEHVITPERMGAAIEMLIARSEIRTKDLAGRLKALSQEKREVEKQLKNLYVLASDGIEMDGSLRSHLKGLQDRREQLIKQISGLERQRDLPVRKLSKERREIIAQKIRQRLMHPDDPGFRRAYLRLMVSQVEVSDEEIRITGPNAALADAAMGEERPDGPVLSFEREWCAGPDSNPGHAD